MAGPRYSRVTAKEVNYSPWLVFEEAGSVRLTRSEPSLHRAERAMHLSMTLPRSLWAVPQLRATITVPDGASTIPPINIELAREAMKAAIGVDIDIRAVPPGEER